jgi:hypothetical protein
MTGISEITTLPDGRKLLRVVDDELYRSLYDTIDLSYSYQLEEVLGGMEYTQVALVWSIQTPRVGILGPQKLPEYVVLYLSGSDPDAQRGAFVWVEQTQYHVPSTFHQNIIMQGEKVIPMYDWESYLVTIIPEPNAWAELYDEDADER